MFYTKIFLITLTLFALISCGERVANEGTVNQPTSQSAVVKPVDLSIISIKLDAIATKLGEVANNVNALVAKMIPPAVDAKKAHTAAQEKSIRHWSWAIIGVGAIAILAGLYLARKFHDKVNNKKYLYLSLGGLITVGLGISTLLLAAWLITIAKIVGAVVLLATLTAIVLFIRRLVMVIRQAEKDHANIETAIVNSLKILPADTSKIVTDAIAKAKSEVANVENSIKKQIS